MNELKIFDNPEFGEVRTLTVNDEPWFVGKDVAIALGYGNGKSPINAVAIHVDEEDKGVTKIMTPGGTQQITIINESGVYALVFGSKLPKAKEFKRWVTHEVIPAIRKHGGYLTPAKVEEALLNPDVLINLATQLKEERAKLAEANKQIEEAKPKVLFADAVSTAKTSILIGELSKLMKQNGVNIGQNRLFDWMRENGYLIKAKNGSYNMPTQSAMERGLLEIKESTSVNPDGSVRVNKTPKVTGKGQVYFINLFLTERGKRNERPHDERT